MIRHCAFCGRAFETKRNKLCCSERCREELQRTKEPLCPYFSHERYGKRGAIFCEGGVIRLGLEGRKAYIRRCCSKIDGGECEIRKQLDEDS